MSDRPEGWPGDVEPMSLQGLKRLGTDRRNRLYWDGKQVRTQLVLNWWQVIVALLAALASLATIFGGINNAATFLCARGNALLTCPPPQGPPPQGPPQPAAPAPGPRPT